MTYGFLILNDCSLFFSMLVWRVVHSTKSLYEYLIKSDNKIVIEPM